MISFKKKLLFAFLFVFTIVAILFIYASISYYSEKTDLDDLVKADAINYKISINDPLTTFERLYASPIWDTYYDHPQLIRIKAGMDQFSEMLKNDQRVSFLAPFLNGELNIYGLKNESETDSEIEIVFTAHMGFKLYFLQKTGLFNMLTSLVAGNIESDHYPGFGTVFHLDLPEPYQDFSFAIRNGYMFIGFSAESLVKLLEGSQVLSTSPGFAKTWNKISKDGILQFYYNPLFSKKELTGETGIFSQVMTVTNGIALSLDTDGLNIRMSGVINIDDSVLVHNPLETIFKKSPETPDNLNLVAAGSAGLIHICLGSFIDLYENTLVELAKDEETYKKFMDSKKFVEEELHIDIKQDFAAWIGHEITIATFTPRTFRSSAEKAIIIETRNKVLAMDAMERVRDALSDAYPISFTAKNYRGYLIHQMELPFYLNVFFGRLFEDMPRPFYAFIDEAFVATDERETLEFIIDSYLRDKTIETDPLFSELRPADEETNMLIYANLTRGIEIANELFSDNMISEWDNLRNYLLQARGGIFSAKKKQSGQMVVEVNVAVKERSREKIVKEWSASIPANMSYTPLLVSDKPGEVPDIYIFTDNGTVYQTDFFGNLLSGKKKKLASRFFTQPIQVEIKGSPYFFVSTGSAILSLDRNLNHVRSYRSRDIISQEPLIDLANGFIYFTDWSGNLYQYHLDSGKKKSSLRLKGLSKTSPVFLDKAGTMLVTASAEGTVYFISDNKGLQIKATNELNEGISSNFSVVEWDNQPFVVFGTWAGIVHVLDESGKERLTYPQKITGRIEAGIGIPFMDDQPLLAVPSTSKLVFVLDEDGNILSNWPVRTYGSIKKAPLMYDLDKDGDLEILILAEDGRLYAFKLNGDLFMQFPIIASAMPAFYEHGTKRFMIVPDWNQKLTQWLLPVSEE